VRTGDEVVASRGLTNVKIVKIDVEGFEPQVCAGLRETLRQQRPFILMELWKFNLDSFQGDAAFPECLYPSSTARELEGRNNGQYRLVPYDIRRHPRDAQAEILIIPNEFGDFLTGNSFCRYLA